MSLDDFIKGLKRLKEAIEGIDDILSVAEDVTKKHRGSIGEIMKDFGFKPSIEVSLFKPPVETEKEGVYYDIIAEEEKIEAVFDLRQYDIPAPRIHISEDNMKLTLLDLDFTVDLPEQVSELVKSSYRNKTLSLTFKKLKAKAKTEPKLREEREAEEKEAEEKEAEGREAEGR